MKVYLCRGKQINFTLPNVARQKVKSMQIDKLSFSRYAQKCEASLVITSDDVTPFANENPTLNRQYGHTAWRNINAFNKPDRRMDMASIKVILEQMTANVDQLNVRVQGKLLQDIKIALGSDIRLQMEITESATKYNISDFIKMVKSVVDDSNKLSLQDLLGKYFPPGTPYNPDDIPLPLHTLKDNQNVAFCEDQISFPEGWKEQLVDESSGKKVIELSAKINLILSIAEPKKMIEKLPVQEQQPDVKTSSDDTGGGTDVEIIASNGKIVKCQGFHLAAQSGILQILLEENRNKLNMTELSEQGVYSFLAYIHNHDITVPWQNSSIAVELFQASHKYGLNTLRLEMKRILLEKPYLWFDINSALCLFFFLAKLPSHLDLKMKALRVIKTSPVSDVVTCEQYQQLFQDLNMSTSSSCKRMEMERVKLLSEGLLSLPMVDVIQLSI